jgi:hypothetical protein
MQTRTPIHTVQLQLEAYNRRDLEAFVALFADNAEVFDLGAAAPTLSGVQEIRRRYEEVFRASPDLHSEVLNRTALQRVVVDLERITGRNGSPDAILMLAIYEVEEGLIRKAHFVRQ